MRHSKYITINTDASYLPNHDIGGYAFHIVCDFFRIKRAGVFKKSPNDSFIAEVMAIGNAVSYLLANLQDVTCDCIVINTDATSAISGLKSRKIPLTQQVGVLIDELKAKSKSNKVSLRHVKGHSRKTNARSYVNRWCDKEAGEAARSSIKNK